MQTTTESTESAVPRSVGRAFDLLEIVVAEGETNLTAAAAAAGLTPTTALRHLRALESRGYLRRDLDGSYSAGPTVLRLAAAAHDDGPFARLVRAAQPVLDDLTGRTGESSYLAVSDGERAISLATCESKRSIRHVGWVGKAVPLAGTAVGEALAGLPGARAMAGSVEADIAAVARGVLDGDRVVAALSVIGPSHRMDDTAIELAASALRDGVARVATELGVVPGDSPNTSLYSSSFRTNPAAPDGRISPPAQVPGTAPNSTHHTTTGVICNDQ
jgi:IclR family acetate operon transcriptional repressor